jgi:L,D-peptidoglycan transpeptidase YkuD (ErfK/YbiS/YcfS/YnhG family)
MMRFRSILLSSFAFALALLLVVPRRAVAGPLDRCGQAVVTVADDWNSTAGRMQVFERERGGPWRPVFDRPVPVLLGKGGLAWGRGVYGQTEKAPYVKKEGDRRTPAGIFRIGKVLGYDPRLTVNTVYPYHQVGKWDAWPDDPANKYYNQHIVVDPKRVPNWFEAQKMRHNDEAYRFLIDIRHNSDPPVPGLGSATFFHTRRGPTRPTSGCTTMSREDLLRFMGRLRADKQPHYVVMPVEEYAKRQKELGLPPMP